MSSKSSESDQCSVSDDDSEFNYIPGNYFVIESGADDNHGKRSGVTSSIYDPYSCEPIADEDWITEYRQRQAEKEQRLASLNDRLAGRENLSNW